MIKIIIALMVALIAPIGYSADFKCFYDAATAFRLGQNPYLVSGFYSPAHLLIYIVPLSLLPYELALRISIFIGSLAFLFVLKKRLILFFTPFVLLSVMIGNLEWTTALATAVNPLIGIPLALIKPQLGWFLAIYLTIYAFFNVGKLKTIIIIFLMFISFLITLIGHPQWSEAMGKVWNISIFPYGLVIGIPLLILSIYHRDKVKALATGLFFSPYVSYTSIGVLIPLFIKYKKISTAIFIAGIVLTIVGLRIKI